MKFGAITNSWREHLAGASIDALVGEAAAREIAKPSSSAPVNATHTRKRATFTG